MPTTFDAQNAISFLTAAVRIPTGWTAPLMASEEQPAAFGSATPRTGGGDDEDDSGTEQEIWEQEADEILRSQFAAHLNDGSVLLPLDDVAGRLETGFHAQLKESGLSAPLLVPQPRRQRGILDYHELRWINSRYFPTPPVDGILPTSTVVAFKPFGNVRSAPWREYLLDTPNTESSYQELAAVFDVLGLMAQRRSLISVSAQRRLHKIALPWGRCRFTKHDGDTSRLYLLVPVLTMVSRRGTSRFRRTLTLTVFLLPNTEDPLPALDTKDLASLCQQAAWSDQNPKRPMIGSNDFGRPRFEGPLEHFLRSTMLVYERHLPIVFDAIFRKVIDILGVIPRNKQGQSVRMLTGIGRARSIVFGSVLHVDGDDETALWSELTAEPKVEEGGQARQSDLARHVGQLLSVNAARHGRERLVGGLGFRLGRMRVTNRYEQDTESIVLYNPMSRFMVNIMPKSLDRFPTVSLKLGIGWLNLLAGTASSIKEILRSYRYEIEQLRNRIESLSPTEDPRQLLRRVHRTTLAILEEIDVVYSFDLVTPTYRASHARILDMEGIAQERDALMRELETTTALLRSEESDKLSRDVVTVTQTVAEASDRIAAASAEIAKSTGSTDKLTIFLAAFGVLSLMLVADTLIDFSYREQVVEHKAFVSMVIVDVVIFVVAILMAAVYWIGRRK